MAEMTFTIKNKTGLHARPAASFVKKANTYKSEITVVKDDHYVDAKSIIALLSLGAGKGDNIKIIAEGEDAQKALDELAILLNGFID